MEMENENDLFVGEYQELCVVHNDPLLNLYTSAVKFDSHEQLFWAGSQSGRMSSYYGSQMVKYTSFKAHHTEICDILTDAHGVLSLTNNEVRYTTKQGLKIFSSRNENMHSMRALLRGTGVAETYVLMAGENEYFFELDLTTGYVYEKNKIENASTVVMKQSSHYICCGQKNGKIGLYDPDRMDICHTLDAHSGSLLDFDLSGNTLVTCGFSSRYGHLSADQYIMVYDLRTLRSFPPVHVPIQPSYVRFMPTYTLRCLLVSQTGQFMFCQPDSLTLDQYLYNVNNGDVPITSCCVSDTYQGIGFGDAAGYVHLWADRAEDDVLFNHTNQLSVFPDEIESLESFSIDDWSVPLTSIQMPECLEPLLSDWPEHLLKRIDRPTPPLDPEILKNVTMRQFVGYAPNPKTKLRNQVAYNLDLESNGSKYPESPMSRDGGKCVIPKIYQKVDIKYSKYGVEDFNFKHYNQTPFSGLEIHIPNAYCNAMLQVFYFLDVLRASMHNHLCQREFCIACELGFLFYMLDVADGQTCQASNFLRTFRTLPEASALGLLVNENLSVSCNRSISQTIQNWNRFVLRQLHQDTKNTKENSEEKTEEKTDISYIVETTETDQGEAKQKVFGDDKVSKFECSSDIKELFGMDIISNRTCKCGIDSERKATLFSIDLSYPETIESDDDVYPFVKILNESIVRKQSTQAWCESCKKYQNSTQFRKVISVPPVLNINCRLDNAKEISFWKKQQELADPVDDAKKSSHSQPKLCRYGKFCNRQGCRFVHQGREGEKLLTPPGSEVDEALNEKSKHWLPTLIQVKHNKETQEVNISQHNEENNQTEGIVYRLISNVCHIYDSSFGSTLVSHIKVGKQYHLIKEGKEHDHWYLFNDFAIAPISENDAVTFNLSWKVPCILMYVRQDISHNLEVKPKFDSSLLFAERSLATRQARFSRNFTPLNSTEILKEGDIVGVDAEFVTLNQEESEMRRDGTLSTLRPSQMSVARITVVRGWGPLTGVPFIDDYISTSEQVVDYLTKFSGIKPGDLDASMSSKHLTTLKLAYQKLRYLIGRKVVFIGHGLKKDFRVINLVIPRDQVVDTVELFHIPKQRYVSLKFLAWHFLNIKIQADCHDSAEDAYTALKLYEKYRELLRAGEWVLEEELEILYDTGRQYNWQVPD